jgi:heat shock protein HslJ
MTDHPDGPGPTATSDALAGTEWAIVRLGEVPVLEADQPLVIAFGHDGRVSGSTGVNQLTASYSLTADYLTFGPLATTRRAGTPELMEQEHRVVQSLAGMCPFELMAHTLSIEGPLGRVELVSTAPLPAAPLERELSRPTDG